MFKQLGAALFLFAVKQAESHSWIECTDYRGNKSHYESSECYGFPRGYAQERSGAIFGQDTGFENLNSAECQFPFGTTYTTSFPKATYSAGQKVCLAWPSKNHVADTCTNKYIPDNGNFVFASSKNPTSDPSVTTFMTNQIADLGTNPAATIAHEGFQNCPAFCENMDKALCTQCFTVPSLAAGTYSFMWRWEFNAGQFYSTCWDATVSSGSSATTTTTTSAPTTLITTTATTTSKLTVTTTTAAPTTKTTAASTTAPATTTSGSSGSCLSGVSVKEVNSNSWPGHIQKNLAIVNSSGKDVCSVRIDIGDKSQISDIWSVLDKGTYYAFPTYVTKLAKGSEHAFGFVYDNSQAPAVSVCAKAC